jgi:hypothetical protein
MEFHQLPKDDAKRHCPDTSKLEARWVKTERALQGRTKENGNVVFSDAITEIL